MALIERTQPLEREARFVRGVERAGRFLLGRSDVHKALEKLVARLEGADIPYAIVGGMALNAAGYERVTADVDVLLTHAGLEAFKRQALGRGYLEKFPGSRGVRDAENSVDIDIVLTGDFPGDGLPKPVAFPDPAEVAVKGQSVALLPLPRLLELKLASGISAPHRLRDLADVLEVIRILDLPAEFEDELDPYVRAKFQELWQAARGA